MEGRLLEVTEKSPMEKRDPVCSIFPSCGGCMYQTMSYEDQLAMKAGQVKNCSTMPSWRPARSMRRGGRLSVPWNQGKSEGVCIPE